MMNKELAPLVDAILNVVVVDEIYQWIYARDGKKYQMLHIHLPPQAGLRFVDARELVESAVGSHPNLHVTVHFTHEVQKRLDEGLSRVHLICRVENRIYQNPVRSQPLALRRNTVDDIVEKGVQYMEAEKTKIQSFVDGYTFFRESKNFGHAAFMLHQAIELALRTAENLLRGDALKSHSLKNNIDYLRTFDSKLGKLADKPEERRALEKIDAAYVDYRYGQDFVIEEGLLTVASQIAQQALHWLETYQACLHAEVSYHLDPQQIQERRVLHFKNTAAARDKNQQTGSYQDLILNALEVYCTPALVVCVGYNTGHFRQNNLMQNLKHEQVSHAYYLFVAYEDMNPAPMELSSLVMGLLPVNVSITLILEETNYFIQALRKGHPFFMSLMKAGDMWFQQSAIASVALDEIKRPSLQVSYVREQWHNRYNRACCLHAVYKAGWSCSVEAMYYTLSQALEQTCLGVINTVLQYKPNTFGLNFLIGLCRLVVPEACATFCLDNAEQRKLFRKIVDAQQQFKYNANYQADPLAVGRVQEMIHIFMQTCHMEMERFLQEVELSSVSKGVVEDTE
ncbi:HEPN domain-containing protein [Sphingobacterium suaedae]|uniref:HEPN domain-containing protein n=1 Tax=Sphingobacterium suaedae TaxID=1686402 RepID=A0ABW5KCK2_9SPHI